MLENKWHKRQYYGNAKVIERKTSLGDRTDSVPTISWPIRISNIGKPLLIPRRKLDFRE